MLLTSLNKVTYRLIPLLALSLTGCGLTQTVNEGTKSTFNALFYKNIRVLRLDMTAREALNTDSRENNSLSESVVIRVWQLRDRKAFDKLVYQQLISEGESALSGDLLASRDLVLKPGADVSLTMPMEANTEYVAVIGLFRDPQMNTNHWKQVLKRNELEPDRPRVVEAGNNGLNLLPLKNASQGSGG